MIEQEHAAMVAKLKKPGEDILATLTPEKVDMMHMAFGLAGEAGEILDNIKRHVFYNKPFNRDNLVEELGDIEFYMEGLRDRAGITREETLKHNSNKLSTGNNARYKEGYSDQAAQDRADKVA